jgi:hypothetical protein
MIVILMSITNSKNENNANNNDNLDFLRYISCPISYRIYATIKYIYKLFTLEAITILPLPPLISMLPLMMITISSTIKRGEVIEE